MFDMVNGLFELAGAVLIVKGTWKLFRERQLKGYDWMATAVFLAYGLWNLFFYPSQGLYWSWCGGMAVVSANGLWLLVLLWVHRQGLSKTRSSLWIFSEKGWEYVGKVLRP